MSCTVSFSIQRKRINLHHRSKITATATREQRSSGHIRMPPALKYQMICCIDETLGWEGKENSTRCGDDTICAADEQESEIAPSSHSEVGYPFPLYCVGEFLFSFFPRVAITRRR